MVDLDPTTLESLVRKHAAGEMNGVDPAVIQECTNGACGSLREPAKRGRSK